MQAKRVVSHSLCRVLAEVSSLDQPIQMSIFRPAGRTAQPTPGLSLQELNWHRCHRGGCGPSRLFTQLRTVLWQYRRTLAGTGRPPPAPRPSLSSRPPHRRPEDVSGPREAFA
jgi:hypothetical protein